MSGQKQLISGTIHCFFEKESFIILVSLCLFPNIDDVDDDDGDDGDGDDGDGDDGDSDDGDDDNGNGDDGNNDDDDDDANGANKATGSGDTFFALLAFFHKLFTFLTLAYKKQ